MEIAQLTDDRFEDYFNFIQNDLPPKENIKERFVHEVLNNPFLIDKKKPNVLISWNEKKQMVGQLICNPFKIYFKNKLINVSNSYDFIVLKEYRGKGIGSSIARIAAEKFKPCIVIGVTSNAKKIDLSLGKLIGHVYNFIWVKDFFTIFFAFLYGLTRGKLSKSKNPENTSLPITIDIDESSFILINLANDFRDYNWDENTLQFARLKEFLDWRYFSQTGEYYMYILDNSNPQIYFVVRKSIKKGLKIFELVDYKIPLNDSKSFKLILNAVKKLTRINNYDGIVTVSTNRFFDDILKQNHFLKYSRPKLIISNVDVNGNQKNIEKRNFLYATMIDCPG